MLDLGFAQALEILDDVGPFELVTGSEEAVLQLLAQNQGEKGTEDVTADGVVAFVEDRAGGEEGFCGAEDVLDHPAVAIAQDDLERGELGVGAQHIDAVEEGVEGNAARVDFEAAPGFEAEKAAITAVAHQAFVAAGERLGESRNDGGTFGGILMRLGLVATDNVAAAPRFACGVDAGADDLLDQQVGGAAVGRF